MPDDHAGYRTKPAIPLAEIDRARAAGLRFGCVLADAGCGLSASFRQALSERCLTWAVGIGPRQKVYPVDVSLIFPVAGRGRLRKNHVPDAKSVSAEKTLAAAPWRTLSWRRGTRRSGKKEARARHRSRPCQQSVRPSSRPSKGHRQHGARTATGGSVLRSCQSSARATRRARSPQALAERAALLAVLNL